jgi:hypothetical protein
MTPAKILVRMVTVECPFCGWVVESGAADWPDDGLPAMHTEEHHVSPGARQCRNCWRRFEVPNLSTVFRRITPSRGPR